MTALDPVFAWTLRLALGALFAAAAWHKLRDPRAFAATLGAYRLLPRAAVPAVAWLVPLAEAAVATALVAGGNAPAAAWAALGLLAAYTGAIGVNLARGRRDVDCGCLGPGRRQPLAPWLLVRNAALAGGAAAGLLPVALRPLGAVDALSVAGGVATLALLWAALHRLAALPTARAASGTAA